MYMVVGNGDAETFYVIDVIGLKTLNDSNYSLEVPTPWVFFLRHMNIPSFISKIC